MLISQPENRQFAQDVLSIGVYFSNVAPTALIDFVTVFKDCRIIGEVETYEGRAVWDAGANPLPYSTRCRIEVGAVVDAIVNAPYASFMDLYVQLGVGPYYLKWCLGPGRFTYYCNAIIGGFEDNVSGDAQSTQGHFLVQGLIGYVV